jgi:hypothetical protein
MFFHDGLLFPDVIMAEASGGKVHAVRTNDSLYRLACLAWFASAFLLYLCKTQK